MGQNTSENSALLQNLLDEEVLNKIYISTASKIWSGFITFGTAIAGVFGIFLIIIKIVFDTMIYALHSVYGCSIHLLGAVWSSFTHLLLHLASKSKVSENRNNESRDVSAPTQLLEHCENYVETQWLNTSTIPVTYTFYDLQSRIDDTEQILQFK